MAGRRDNANGARAGDAGAIEPALRLFRERNLEPFAFQRETWEAYLRGESGLLHAPTGTGKTLAVWLGPLAEWIAEGRPVGPRVARKRPEGPPLRVLWITPLRALAADTTAALADAAAALGAPWTIELRTGDTSASARRRQRERLPTALVTTPESLSLLLTYPDAHDRFASLRCVVVDEWHELLGTKRGVQTELGLARLRRLAPGVRTWGLSATLGNLDEAIETLLGQGRAGEPARRIIRGDVDKRCEVVTLLPPDMNRFPWSGHLGSAQAPGVVEALERAGTTLLFTNTRSQTELWFQAILRARPDWHGSIALHHGSLDRAVRERVEAMLARGELRCVVCTSSLDLGVDFRPVDQVIQVGSPKGVARLVQRAGRSGHRPGAVSRALGVPTHALELVEFAAARAALGAGQLESRKPLSRPLDVLVQHLVTLALGGGFRPDEALAEVRTTHAYATLTDREWSWAMDFVARGGPALKAYPQYARVVERDGLRVVASPQIARLHRMCVGTITSDGAVSVRFRSGASLGSVEEGFVSRLVPGDRFVFAGRTLELLELRDMTAWVRPARSRGSVPRWGGAKMPLSTQLSAFIRLQLERARRGDFDGPEMGAARRVLDLQRRWSRIPAPDELLIERTRTRDGFHAFIYPFEGRLAHEGLAALAAHRLAAHAPMTLTYSMNDYGFSLVAPTPFALDERGWRRLFSPDRLIEDLLECINTVALARRAFRGVARVAGLIFPGFPGAPKTARQLQASSELFFDVFSEFDPGNMLLDQARREVLERELEVERIRAALDRMAAARLVIADTRALTPMAFPLWAEFLQSQVSSEAWPDRVRKMAVQLEHEADEENAPAPPRRLARRGKARDAAADMAR